jgi:hypothetical protein
MSVRKWCGARTQAGGWCRQLPLRGRNRCRRHGMQTGPRSLEGKRKAAESMRRLHRLGLVDPAKGGRAAQAARKTNEATRRKRELRALRRIQRIVEERKGPLLRMKGRTDHRPGDPPRPRPAHVAGVIGQRGPLRVTLSDLERAGIVDFDSGWQVAVTGRER